jgi:hypothetical protein
VKRSEERMMKTEERALDRAVAMEERSATVLSIVNRM